MVKTVKQLLHQNGLVDGPYAYRAFAFVLALTALLTFVATLLNILFGMPWELVIATGIAFGSSVSFLGVLLKTRQTDTLSIIAFFVFLLFSVFSWLHNGGADGPTPTVLVLLGVVAFVTVPNHFRIPSFILLVAVNSLLLYIHYAKPEMIDNYAQPQQRFLDLLTAMLMQITAFYVLIAMLRKLFLNEHRRIIQQNEELVQKNELIRQFSEEQKQINATREKFYSIVAHDLRGPFSVFLGISDIFEKEYDQLSRQEVKELSEQLNKALHRQFNLLNDLLEWSKMQYAEFGLHKEAVELKRLADDVTEELRLSASQKKISLLNNVNESCLVFADPNYVKLLLRNLISNSIKFTHEGGAVIVMGEIEDGFAEISVQDNGVGIPQQNMDRLFREVTRITTRGTANEIGTGFGLLLCREIVYNHGGSIWVDSREGAGSTFHFTLPQYKEKKIPD